VEAGREFRAELEGIDDQAHARSGRIDVFLLRDVLLEDVVLNGAGNFLPVGTLLFGNDQVHRPEHASGRIDGHRGGDFFQIDAVEKDLHVFERVDGNAALADFAFAGRMIGVVAHERGQVEGHGKASAAVLEQILRALVGFLGRGEAGEHAHGPELAAVSGRVNAARVGRLAGVAEILIVVPVGGEIGLRVKAADGDIRNGAEAGVAVGVAVGAGGRADGLLGSFLDRRRERLFGPGFFGGRRVTAFEYIGDWIFGNGWLVLVGSRFIFWHAAPHRLRFAQGSAQKTSANLGHTLSFDDRGAARQPQLYEPTERLLSKRSG